MATTLSPEYANRNVSPQITGVLAVFLPDGITVTEDSGSYVTGAYQFPEAPSEPPTDPTADTLKPWVSFGLLGAFQSVATQVESEVTRFHGGALGYRQLRKNTTTGKRMTFTTPDMSPEYFQLSFALGKAPVNGEENTTVGHGGDNKIEGYIHFWYQNDVGEIYLTGTAHGALRLLNDPEHTTAIGSSQFEFEMDYKGEYKFTTSNVQDEVSNS